MTVQHLNIDIETYSSIDLKKSGLYKYVQSDDFDVLLIAYCFDGGVVQIVDLAQGEQLPEVLVAALQSPAVIKHAYNAAFEWYCLAKYLGIPDPKAWLPQWRCTMIHGLYCGLVRGLGKVGEALGLPEDKQKNKIGSTLIQIFCKPGKKGRVTPQQEPQKWQLFKDYCKQDVVTEMEIGRRLAAFPVPDFVQQEWEQDIRINCAGVRLDMDLAEGAIAYSNAEKDALLQEARIVTGLANPNSPAQLKTWLERQIGTEIPSLSKEAIAEMLEDDDLPIRARRALELRQRLGKTSVSKYQSMIDCVCKDGRMRGLLQFYGASRTGRWAGRLVQVQNLPRNYIEELDYARDLVKQGDVFGLQYAFGNVPDTLSQLIRTAFIPAEGHTFVVADFSAIEARVISWLAGESWRLQVFRTHGKIYEASASQMFGVPMERIKKGNPEYSLRAKGKVAELALGYNGGPGALINMGALKMGLSEDELPEIVDRWRAANPNIKRLWYELGDAAMQTVKTGRQTGTHGLLFAYEGDYSGNLRFLSVLLPSGRKLYYANPFIGLNRFGNPSIHYYGGKTGGKWVELETYGGKLTENIVQAIARDCLAETLRRVEAAGYQTVMHIHDEVVLDVPDDRADLDAVVDLMRQPIPWAPDLPLNAAGFTGKYYKKD